MHNINSEKALEHFITVVDFSWKVSDIVNISYPKYKQGFYVSHTAKLCCEFYDKCITEK
jgi:hypothetical protein